MIGHLLSWLDRRIDARIAAVNAQARADRAQAEWDSLSPWEKGRRFGEAAAMKNGGSDGGASFRLIDKLSNGSGR